MPPRRCRCFWAALALLAAPCRLLESNAGASAPGSRTRLRGPRRPTNASSALQLVQPGAASSEVVRRLPAPTSLDRRRLSEYYAQLAKLTASDGEASDWFGWSVAVDGNTVVVGNPTRDTNIYNEAGIAYIFRTADEGATYAQVAMYTGSKDYAKLGYSVAVDGDTVVVGAREEKDSSCGSGPCLLAGIGKAYVFRTTNGGVTYGQVAKLGASDASYMDLFGYSVAISGATIAIGAAKAGTPSFEPGAVYVFRTSDDWGTYTEIKLTASALLGAASGLPLVGPLCDVAKGILGDVEEFSEKADDVLVAARRVIDVLDVVDLMSKNVSKCSDGKDIAQANMQRLIDLLKEFHAAVRAFGQKGWLKRAFTMQSHVKKLGRIDKRIVEQLGVFRLSYQLAIDAKMMERTYQIEQSIAALVAKRVVEKGESEEKAAAALSEDAVAITSVAVDAHVPPTEIATELQEFRLEVRQGLAKLDQGMRAMLERKNSDRQHLRSIMKAVNAGVRRDENLLAAVEAGAERDKQILAALNRDGSFKEHVKNISDSLEKKLQHGAARRDKRKNLKDFEIKPEYVDPDPFARGGQAVVRLAEYAAETVCIKCINMVGVPAAERMKMYQSFATELSIMVRLRHPRIVQVLGIITTDATYLGLVMEYMPGGSLRQALVKEDEIMPEFQRLWASDVAQGMAYLYSCKIEHRDLKAANVLLTLDGRGKISDFGLGKADDLKTSTTASTMRDGGLAGTPAFMAPELLDENVFTEKSDVYSYAMVLWEIYDRRLPWAGLKPQQILSKVLIKRARPDIPKTMPSDMISLMKSAWADEPDARPSFADICKQLKATTPKRPSSTSEIRPWSSPRASDEEERQGSMRSMFAHALSNFRSTSSLDVGGDEEDDGDDGAPAVAREAPAATEGVQAPTATAPAKSSASAKKAAKAPIKAAPRPAATKKAPTTVAQRPAPAKASKAGAGASRSNWFRGPTKKAAKAPAAETDLEAPSAPAQPAPKGDLEEQTSAAPAPAPSPAPSRSSWFPSRAGAKTDIEAGRAQTAGGPAAPVFVVSGKSGARLRAGVELDSALVADLPSGTVVTIRERATTHDGAERCCVISGDTIGWLSAKLLVTGDMEADDGPAATAAGTQSSIKSKLRAAIHASTAFGATADVPPPPPESRGGPPDLPPPAPSSPWFDSNFWGSPCAGCRGSRYLAAGRCCCGPACDRARREVVWCRPLGGRRAGTHAGRLHRFTRRLPTVAPVRPSGASRGVRLPPEPSPRALRPADSRLTRSGAAAPEARLPIQRDLPPEDVAPGVVACIDARSIAQMTASSCWLNFVLHRHRCEPLAAPKGL